MYISGSGEIPGGCGRSFFCTPAFAACHDYRMRLVILALVILVGCGSDQCADYAKTFCGKVALCDSAAWTATCETQTIDGTHAAHMTQEQCKKADDLIAPMGCASFNALLRQAINSR